MNERELLGVAKKIESEYHRKWRELHPDKVREYRKKSKLKKALKFLEAQQQNEN